MALGIIAFLLMFKVDWEKYFEKFVTGEKDNSRKPSGDS
jgi:hypothetical protein